MASTTAWERTLLYLGLRGNPPLLSKRMRVVSTLVVVVLAVGLVIAVVQSKWVRAALGAIPLLAITFSLIADQRRRAKTL